MAKTNRKMLAKAHLGPTINHYMLLDAQISQTKSPEKLKSILNTNTMKTCKIIGFWLKGYL